MPSMMARASLALFILQIAKCVVADDYGEYPTSYPYEIYQQPGMSFDWTDMPQDMPNLKFDDTDPGGYHWHGHYLTTALPDQPKYKHINDQSPPFALFPTMIWGGAYYYQTQTSWDLYSSPPPNCTEQGMPLVTQDYVDALKVNEVFTAQGICSGGGCCTNVLGLRARFPDADARIITMSQALPSGGCPSTIDDDEQRLFFEWAVCDLIHGNVYECSENLVSRTERVKINGCGDAILDLLQSCAVFGQVGFPVYYDMEPSAYIEKLSGIQINQLFALVIRGDKICHPKSYFMPSGGSGGSTPTTPVGEDSSATAVKASLMVALALFYFA